MIGSRLLGRVEKLEAKRATSGLLTPTEKTAANAMHTPVTQSKSIKNLMSLRKITSSVQSNQSGKGEKAQHNFNPNRPILKL